MFEEFRKGKEPRDIEKLKLVELKSSRLMQLSGRQRMRPMSCKQRM
jgi:hypothetical protein